MADKVGARAKVDALESENTRLKAELQRKDEQLVQIKTRFTAIVEELQKRELPLGGPRGPATEGASASTEKKELAFMQQRLNELAKKLAESKRLERAAAQDVTDWRAKCKRLQTDAKRHASYDAPFGAKENAGAKDAMSGQWKAKCKTLQKELVTLKEQMARRPLGPAKVETVRALRPRRAASPVRSPSRSPPRGRPGTQDSLPRTVDFQQAAAAAAHEALGIEPAPQPALMNAWSQTRTVPDLAPTAEALTRMMQTTGVQHAVSTGHIGTSPIPYAQGGGAAGSATSALRPASPVHAATSPLPMARMEAAVDELKRMGTREGTLEPHRGAAGGGHVDASVLDLIDALRSESVSLQRRLEETLIEKDELASTLNILSHEREMLGDKGAQYQGAVEDLIQLRQEMVEKNAKLVLLDSRFAQAQKASESLKENQAELIQELQRMNDRLVEANQKLVEAESALQLARLGQGRMDGLEDRLKERGEETRLLNAEIERLMNKCHTVRSEVTNELKEEWERQVDALQKKLEDSERNNKKLFRDSQLLTAQRDEIHGTWVQVQKERDALDTEVLKLRAQTDALRARVKLFGPAAGEQADPQQEEDVHKALALIQHHRRRGDPTDLEFLIKAWDVGGAELGDLRAENLTLQRELQVAKKRMDVQREQIALDEEKFAGWRDAAEGKDQLLENMGEKLRRLTDDVARYKGVAKKMSPDSDASSVVAGEHENVLELAIAHLEVAGNGAGGVPPTYFVTIDFLDFETCVTESLTGQSVTFEKVFCFTVEVSLALRHYIQHKDVAIELHRTVGLSYESVAKGAIGLKALLAPACDETRGHVAFETPEGVAVGVVEYAIKLKRPLPLDWVGLPEVCTKGAEANLAYTFRHVRRLKLTIHECRGLLSDATPIPYVLVTALSGVLADKPHLPDLTAEMAHPQGTRDPVFHFSHEYGLVLDPASLRYLSAASLNFVVMDDCALDPRTPPLGKASLALLPMFDSPAATIDAVLELSDFAGNVTGQVVVGLRWLKTPGAAPLYIEGL
eukprot:TRINITY_DN14984_c0_g1_i1.p1 TRINITY_DN14984_c0_g1~~TRINITY_DN14984_c0_g1_i1.p1  ORF type:complete len:1028 (+),score=434.24 TRINITY_DN14984_c0_g1_i1:103-3186(+)